MDESKSINEYSEYYGREFDKNHQVTIDKFVDFLIDMIDEGVNKDAKIKVCGSDHFSFITVRTLEKYV